MQHQEIVFAGKGRIELAPVADVPPLGRSEVRGPTLATLISPGTELAWATGDSFPIRPGYASVFTAEEIGPDVAGIAPGDRLFSMGPHRSVQQVGARFTVKLADGMASATALIARLMGVSITTLMTTAARPGDLVVVAGVGPVGYLAAHQFVLAGYEVLVVEPDAGRRALLAANGLTSVAAMPVDDPAIAGKVALVVECSGHEASVLGGCRVVRPFGEVVMIGVPWRRQTEIFAHELVQAIFQRFVILRSGWEWELPIVGRDFRWEELLEGYNNAQQTIFTGFAKALKWLEAGRIPHREQLRAVDPRAAAEVYRALAAREIGELFLYYDWTQLRG